MSPFPILLLPPKLISSILKRLDFRDLLDLSLCSDKAREAIKLHFSFLSPPLVTLSESFIFIDSDSKSAIWDLENRSSRSNIKNLQNRFIRGKRFGYWRDENNSPHFLLNTKLDGLKLLEHLLDTFCAESESFDIDWKAFKVVKSSKLLQKSHSFIVNDFSVSHEEMRWILEDFQTENLSLYCNPGADFVYDKVIIKETLFLDYSRWFSLQNLLETSAKEITLRRSLLSSQDLNTFISRWMNSSMDFEFLSVQEQEEEARGDIEYPFDLKLRDIVKGLKTTRGSPKPQPLKFNGRFAKFEHGLDLKRETDGVMATVLIYEAVNCRRRRTKNFVFNVWNNRLE